MRRGSVACLDVTPVPPSALRFSDHTPTFYTQGAEGYVDYPTYSAPGGPFGKWGKFQRYLAKDEWEPEVAAEASD